MLPNLVIIGAMKAGTSSLHHYLGLHPEISMSWPKELDFFLDRNWRRGTSWYESQFRDATPVRGEASPNYTKATEHESVPERMHSVIPEAKLVYLVRDPVERIVSHYLHYYASGAESRSLSEALGTLEGNPYVDASRYHMQLQAYLPYFDLGDILIETAEDLRLKRREVLRRTFAFLAVDPDFTSGGFEQELHDSSVKGRKSRFGIIVTRSRLSRKVKPYVPWTLIHLVQAYTRRTARPIDPPALTEGEAERLADYLHEDVQQLRSLTGRRFEGWSV